MTFEAAYQEVIDTGYKCAWLETSRGVTLVRKNQPVKTIAQQLDRFKKYLATSAMIDGWYTICLIPSVSSKDEPIAIKFYHGHAANMAENKNLSYTVPEFSLDKYLELVEENAKNKAELDYLRRENDRLQTRNEHLEETADSLREGQATLSAGPSKPIIETLAELIGAVSPVVAPFLEEWREDRASKRKQEGGSLDRIAKMMQQLTNNQAQQAQQLAEMQKRQEAPGVLPEDAQPITVEDLAGFFNAGQCTMEEAMKVLDGQAPEVIQYFHQLIAMA